MLCPRNGFQTTQAMRLFVPRLIVLLTAVGAITCRCSSQDSNLEKSKHAYNAYEYITSTLDTMALSYEYVTSALDAMIRSNSTNNKAAYQREINDAAFSVSQSIKWCKRGREAVVATSQEVKSMGCLLSQTEFSKASELILTATQELLEAESNFTQAAGAENPFYVSRMYDEVPAHIASAQRYLKLASEEIKGGIVDTKECVH